MKNRTPYKFTSQTIYPEVYFSNEVISYNKNWREIVLEKLSPPEIETNIFKPKKPDKPNFELAIFIGIPIIFGIFIYAFIQNVEIMIFLFFGWLFLYLANFVYMKFKYPGLLEKFELESKEYESKLLSLEQEVVNRENEIQKIKEKLYTINLKWSESQRLEHLANLLSTSKKARLNYNNPKIGASETIFLNVLKEYFKEQIYTNKAIEIFSYKKKDYWDDVSYEDYYDLSMKNDNDYCPDFIFEHDKTDLIIDIEIDEPYTLGQPIHYLDSIHDNKRNGYFLENGWVVIRFSEMQIKLEPKSCCKEIAEVIFDLTGDYSYLNLLKDEPRLFRHSKWTKTEAETYIKRKIRKNHSIMSLDVSNKSINDIFGLWVRYNKYYLFKKDNNVIEYIVQDDKLEITDEGNFIFIRSPDGRMAISVNWKKSKVNYIVERTEGNILILTDVSNRNSFKFIKNTNQEIMAKTIFKGMNRQNKEILTDYIERENKANKKIEGIKTFKVTACEQTNKGYFRNELLSEEHSDCVFYLWTKNTKEIGFQSKMNLKPFDVLEQKKNEDGKRVIYLFPKKNEENAKG